MNEAQYRQALAAHDWYFEYSDDHQVWKAGREQYRALTAAQRELDPDHAIWDALAPAAMRFTQRAEVVA